MADELAARRRKRATTRTSGASLARISQSFIFSIEDRQLSPATAKVYRRTLTQLGTFLAGAGYPDGIEQITPEQLREFLAFEADRTSAISAHQHYRNLRAIFRWLVREGERTPPSPMERVDAPKTTRKVKPVIPDTARDKLLKSCEGNTFEQRRDAAILSILIDTGVRVSGLAGMKVADVSLVQHHIKVVLKGGDEHLVPLGKKTTAAVDRYLRARARHNAADSEWLWLGLWGQRTDHLGVGGICRMLERRAKACGLGRLSPHAFRRTFAHDWFKSGAVPQDGMRVAGWKNMAMMELYAGELADERAREAHALFSPRDRLQ